MISKIAVVVSAAYIVATSAQYNEIKKSSAAVLDQTTHEVQHCPDGYTQLGKECAKTLTEQPDVVCPSRSHLVDGKCVAYVGKESQCPASYTAYEGLCKRTITAAPEIVCPPNYMLRSKDFCVTTVTLPDKVVCPASTVPKGDKCASYKTEAPTYVCPNSYNLVGDKCVLEETYVCTPQRVPKEPIKRPETEHDKKPEVGKESVIYEISVSKPVVEEYVTYKECKRITTEPARPICSGGVLSGKMCKTDVLVEPLKRPGGYGEKIIRASTVCPDEYTASPDMDECYLVKEVMPEFYCPSGTVDLETRCAVYSKPKTTCPEGYYLNDKICNKTVYTKPLVEVTITYSCRGKGCKEEEKRKE